MSTLDPIPSKRRYHRLLAVLDALSQALPYLYVSSAIVVLGAILGRQYLSLGKHPSANESDLIGCFAAWDGEHYVRIAQEGYSYNPDAMSNVAFFPAHPLAGRFIAFLTGWRVDYCLLLASYVFLIAGFTLVPLYLHEREGGNDITPAVLLAISLFPTTFYFRMAYTESLFLFEVILTLYGLKRRCPIWALAALIGLATATRAAGVVLILPLAWELWQRSAGLGAFIGRSLLAIPTACWGLAAYMTFLYLAFGDPLVFAKTQHHWDQRPPAALIEKLWLEVTLEPLFCEYDPGCPCHRLHAGRDPIPLFSMYSANPVYFVLFAGLIVLGGVKGWLTREEILVGAALLLFSYLMKSYATCMTSQGRYASTVFPVYLVLGRVLRALPRPLAAALLALSALFLGAYSALFVRWHELC